MLLLIHFFPPTGEQDLGKLAYNNSERSPEPEAPREGDNALCDLPIILAASLALLTGRSVMFGFDGKALRVQHAYQ